jgi:hypothetical protein
LPDHPAQREPLDQHSDPEHQDECERDGEPSRGANPRGYCPCHVGAGHGDRALGEVRETGRLVDEYDAEGDESVHQPNQRAIYRQLDDKRRVH